MPAPRVDFYLLASSEPQARWLLACRLLEKAYLRGHSVFVYCNNQEQAELIDDLLWTFKEDSFIPHNLQGEGPEPPPPVQIGFQHEPRGFHDILLNLADIIPPFYQRFRRVMSLVSNQDECKELSRIHYREYRSKQCELHTHPVE
jgi:DNA polymerase-3 subunit chi